MKKFRFNKNTKLFLSTLSVAAATATVLAACKPTPNKEPVKKFDASKDAVQKLLATKGFQTFLKKSNDRSYEAVKAELEKVIGIDQVNSVSLADAKRLLGSKDNKYSKDVKPDGKGQSIYAYVNYLNQKNEEKKADTNIFGEKPEDKFQELKNQIKTVLDIVQELTNNVDVKVFPLIPEKELTNLKKVFEAKLKIYFDSDKADSNKQQEIKIAWKNFNEKLNEKTLKVQNVSESATLLKGAAKKLEKYIKENVSKFLEIDQGEAKIVLDNLINKIETFLGRQGKDLWNGDAPAEVTNENSTEIYKVTALLKKSKSANKELDKNLTQLIFEKDLSLSVENATDLLASVIKKTVPLDSAHLNSYLVNKSSNVVDVLKDETNTGTKNNLIDKAKKIIDGTNVYSQFAGNENSEFAKHLKSAAAIENDATRKAKINAVLTAFTKNNGFGKMFNEFYNKFKLTPKTENANLQKSHSLLDLMSELETQAEALNSYIVSGDDLNGVLKVVAHANEMKYDLINPLSEAITTQNEEAKKAGKNIATLLFDLEQEIGKTENGSLDKAVKEMVDQTGYSQNVKNILEKFAKKDSTNKYIGYYYVLKEGSKPIPAVPAKNNEPERKAVIAQLGLTDLKALLLDFQDWALGSTQANPKPQPLYSVKKILDNLVEPSKESETKVLLEGLYAKYNKAEVAK